MTTARPATSAAQRPNVLLIMCDELKATALGLYGNPTLRTPSLERLARRGILYRHAFTPHPLCVPARVAMWTGRYPHATCGGQEPVSLGEPIVPCAGLRCG